MSTVIDIRDLRYSYGSVVAVDGVSLAVDAGEILALLGPNGAGKTTTVECLEGYLVPASGQVRVLGLDPARDRARLLPRIGVVLQSGGAWQAATPRQMLRLYTRLYPDPADPEELLALLGLGDVAARPYRSLSGGQQQRVQLALALAGRPQVLVLDEPTAGLDPHARRHVWEQLADLRSRGRTVLLTTHLLEEAERLADRVAVIDRGRLLACDRPQALLAAAGGLVVRSPAAIDAAALGTALGVEVAQQGPGRWAVAAGGEAIGAIAAWFAEHGHPLTEVAASSLEDVYLHLTADPQARARCAGPLAPPPARAPGADVSPLPRHASTSAPGRGRFRRVRAHTAMELGLLARNGENLLVALGIPLGLLVFFSLVEVLPTGGRAAVDFLLPRMLTVGVMGSALVATAIATGFERGYLVLKRLGATPLRRGELVGAKALSVLATVAVQAAALLGAAAALGWHAGGTDRGVSMIAAAGALLLGCAAFAGLGLLLAGTLRATVTLALANAVFVSLVLFSGLLFPLDVLPTAVRLMAGMLPSAALALLLESALGPQGPSPYAWAVLSAWAVATPALAAWRFRWQ